jgi:hypothetical protein
MLDVVPRRPAHPQLEECMPRRLPPASVRLPITVLIATAAVLHPAIARSAPTSGFVETWADSGMTTSWSGGVFFENPGHGGVGGADDGYLQVATGTPANLGTVSFGTEYVGDWLAAGIRTVKFWLNDVGADEPLEVHFGIGRRFNFWQYNPGFSPPENAWAQFQVDLTDSTKFTRIIGSGAFAEALQNADRVHLRHDQSPFIQQPDPIQADFGIDNFELSDQSVPVLRTTWGRIKQLYR